ncbi:MAG: YceI family protein [Alphaproteobacteria bacterium]|nr:YceI family protein [Alphaproteobacteria bacterium]MDE2336490.1 YceI family protein [Alphaproteobacteria bacterium]
MKKTIVPAFAIFASFLFSAAAPKGAMAAETFSYDPLHTQVFFTVNHMGFTDVRGRFDSFGGTFTLDEAHPALSRADFTIKASSIDMGSDVWNSHIEEGFLDSAKYPEIVFKSTKVVQTGAKTADMTGDLTLHGVTKPVTLHVTLNKTGVNPFIASRVDAGFSVTGTIKRSDFGMTKFIPVVGDDIGIDIAVDGMRQTDKTNK